MPSCYWVSFVVALLHSARHARLGLLPEAFNCMSDLTFLPATVMAQQIREKKISPLELVDAHLAKIERLNPKLNAYVHVDQERVRREARAAEGSMMKGKSVGPLYGVPISIKSSLGVAGLRCESGTRLRSGF